MDKIGHFYPPFDKKAGLTVTAKPVLVNIRLVIHEKASVSLFSDNDLIIVITAISANPVSKLQLTAVFAA